MTLFSLRGVDFGYRGARGPGVLQGLDLDIPAGGVVALLGPNGSGKTSLLRLLLGHARPQRGQVLLRGRSLAEQGARSIARQLAYVPQNHRAVFPYQVREVVLMGRLAHGGLLGGYGPADRQAAQRAMEAVGVAHLALRPYAELSGGEQKLTLVARALAQAPQAFVLDEPANHLDFGNQARLLDRLARLADQGRTVIFSTHNPDHALRLAQRAVLLRGGRILDDGPPERVLTPSSLEALYGLPLDIVTLADGRRICLQPLGRSAPEHPQTPMEKIDALA